MHAAATAEIRFISFAPKGLRWMNPSIAQRFDVAESRAFKKQGWIVKSLDAVDSAPVSANGN
jgi:hypothetical protein